MKDPNKTQSFVIRIWRESPRLWRGTIRHVQSDAQRGVNRLDQVTRFLEQHADVSTHPSTAGENEHAESFSFGRLFSRRAMVPLWGTAIAMAVIVLGILLAMPGTTVPLNATAVGDRSVFEIMIAFVCGMLTSVVLIGLWFRFFRR